MQRRRVLFPDPLGPQTTTTSRAVDAPRDASQHLQAPEALVHVLEDDRRPLGPLVRLVRLGSVSARAAAVGAPR